MFSRHVRFSGRGRSERRGSVLILVIAVLAMLFVMGATQLMVARSERKMALERTTTSNAKDISTSAFVPVAAALNEGVTGLDANAYNIGWSATDTSLMENNVDFPGAIPINTETDPLPVQLQKIVRNGDLLASSMEPFQPLDGGWTYYALAWSNPTIPFFWDPVAVKLTIFGQPSLIPTWARPFTLEGARLYTAGLYWGDSDGDGVVDSRRVGTVSGCEVYQRVISHGGMVLLDSTTHPALLAQVIHPLDAAFFSQPWTLFDGNALDWNGKADTEVRAKDEGRLRRRFMLAGSLQVASTDWQNLPQGDLRTLLPYTLGYRAAGQTGIPSHYWRVGATPGPGVNITQEEDFQWWQSRITPNAALTEPGYNKNSDTYDRQHLLTTHSTDDLLRPVRDEKGGRIAAGSLPEIRGMFVSNATAANDAPLRSFYYLLNPAESKAIDNTLGGGAYPLQVQPDEAYGMVGLPGARVLGFNKPGLRTPFSLRDTLVDPAKTVAQGGGGGYQASHRRAIQLTAYYLAMMQHTFVHDEHGNRVEFSAMAYDWQLRKAAQLAVNTIDFADDYDANNNKTLDAGEVDPVTRFVYSDTSTGISIDVCGVERQPYITEAYCKIMLTSVKVGVEYKWDETGSLGAPPQKLYAVELYNPYDTPLDLNDYDIRVGPTGAFKYPLTGYTIPAYSYIVLANRFDDPATGWDPFIRGVGSKTSPNQNIFLVSLDTDPTHTDPTKGLELLEGQPVLLVRKTTATLTAAGVVAGGEVTVDRMEPSDLGSGNTTWAKIDTTVRTPTAAGQFLVRDSSLQRRKETATANTAAPYTYQPQYWQFTLSRQVLFPLPWYESAANTLDALSTDVNRPPQHNLLNSAPLPTEFANKLTLGNVSNQEVVGAEFDGRLVKILDPAAAAATPPLDLVAAQKAFPIAPFPVIVADRGMELLNDGANLYVLGTAAFPTTGTLLLVTKDGPTSYNGKAIPDSPLTLSAANDTDKTYKPDTDSAVRIDRGHMSVTDITQQCRDIDPDANFGNMPQGRYGMPWGQLVFQYFTGLPLEDLTNLPTATFQAAYMARYPLVPFVEPTDASSPLGPRVRGRININYAPAWVLDGLPVLPDAVPGSSAIGAYASCPAIPVFPASITMPTTTGVPVSELLSGRLDPVGSGAGNIPGRAFVSGLIDEAAAGLTVERFPTLSPIAARYMVSYREQRSIATGSTSFLPWQVAQLPVYPGLLTAGGLCNVVANIPFVATRGGVTTPGLTLADNRAVFASLTDPASVRPFTYLGYLHLIAPVVRLEDWATVKSHVYTVYNLVGDSNGNWLRSQTTIDRTRCLYSNDLPERIVQTEPMDYFNTISDQQ